MSSQNMKLERILGFTTNGRNSFINQPNSDNLIYIAGCIIVVLNPKTKSQNHLFTISKQNITTLAVSEDGRYLASSDCGTKAKIYIWDLKNFNLSTEFVGHNVEVSCMAFSTDNQFLVSVGCQQDMTLCIWEWQKELKLAAHKVQTKIRAISFSADNSYFVTVGEAYIKYWYIKTINGEEISSNNSSTSHQDSSVDGDNLNLSTTGVTSSISITNKSGILGEQKKNSFCDVKCGRGLMENSTFCITKSGLLCELNSKRLLHKWVDLKTTNANCMAMGDNIIVIGCANGVIRCFNTTELRFLKNLPKPHSLGVDNISKKNEQPILKYPNVISVGLNEKSNAISCIHNDRSIYIWNLSNPDEIVKNYSVLYHSSCIWGIDMYPACVPNSILPFGSFITCSSDDTLRIWNPKVVLNSKLRSRSSANRIHHKDSDLPEYLKIIFTDPTYKYLCDLESSEDKNDPNYDSNEGLRCLKVSPNGKQVAVGSRSGTIRIFDFEKDVEMKSIAAHDAEVLCLEYSDPENFDDYCYLASSSRDKLIHIFDALNDYNFLQTIDDHSSSITAIRFVNNRAKDSLQLISCSADQKIIFRNGSKIPSGQLTFTADQIIEGKTTFYDMKVDTDSSCLMTACQDRMIRLFNVAQVKYQSGFKGSCSDEGTIIKIALDPSCTFLAASSTDKSINIYDYQRGECIASVSYGLSDLVTDLKFSSDGKHLIACSGDGCIFVWSSPAEIANTIGGNLAIAQLSTSNHSSINFSRISQDDGRDQQVVNRGFISNDIDELNHLDDSMNRGAGNKYLVQSVTENEYGIDSGSTIRSSRKGNSILMNNMAKFFQSRDNLDRISSREKYVNESLTHRSDEIRSKSIVNSSLSGMFNKNSSANLEMDGTKSISRYKNNNLSRSSHTLNMLARQEQVSDNELGSLDDNDYPTSGISNFQEANKNRLISSPKLNIYKQNKRNHPTNYVNISEYSRGSNYMADLTRTKSATRLQESSTMRTSKSECNLENYPCDDGEDVIENRNLPLVESLPLSNFCNKLDLSKSNPTSVLITTELCQYIVDELQTMSKYATRLHQRLQRSGETALCNLVARGVQNSMDILSIVPPRASQYHQFQSQVNLSPATMLSRRRMQSPQQATMKELCSSSMDIASNQNCNIYQRSKALKVGEINRRPQLIDNNNENMKLHPGETLAHHQTSLPRSKSNLMSIDQVLEAYSDRLFKMVQEKIASEQSSGLGCRVSDTQTKATDKMISNGNEVQAEKQSSPKARHSFDAAVANQTNIANTSGGSPVNNKHSVKL